MATACRKGFDPDIIKGKDKSAGAFALWVDGVCKVRNLHDEKVPELEKLKETISSATTEFDAKR